LGHQHGFEILFPEGVAEPRYDQYPDDPETRRLSDEFLIDREIEGQTFGAFIIRGDDRFANLGRSVEAKVFHDEFAHAPADMHRLYDRYEVNSTFYVVMDQPARQPIAVMRIGENSDGGLKTFVDLPQTSLKITDDQICLAYEINPDQCVDLTTWGIMPEHRGLQADPTVRNLLFRTLYMNVISNPKYTHMVSIVDRKAQRSLWAYRFPFNRIFDSMEFEYEGSPENFAIIGKNSEFYPQSLHWINKYRTEFAAGGSQHKAKLAEMIDEVSNPDSRLEAMMGS
jgi:hypothetical protein